MTGQELLREACALFFDSDTGYYEPYAAAQINTLLADTFEVNNNLRRAQGKPVLGEILALGTLAQEIGYEEALVRSAFGYGLASRLLFDDNDGGRQAVLEQRYREAVARCDRGWVRLARGTGGR
ncbi:MAG: hypothetical protein RR135_05955 [Oscillospiraceae bacterium]